LTSSSINIKSVSEDNGGSEISSWIIKVTKFVDNTDNAISQEVPVTTETEDAPPSNQAPSPEKTSTHSTIMVTPKSGKATFLDYVIENLEPGAKYQFCVLAVNICGESDESEPCDEMKLGM
jgi:hypothetical protein